MSAAANMVCSVVSRPIGTSQRFQRQKERRKKKLTGSCLGPICRIGPKTLLVSDANFLWKVNGVRSEYIRSVLSVARIIFSAREMRSVTSNFEPRWQRGSVVSKTKIPRFISPTDEETSIRAKRTRISSLRLIITFASSWDSSSANISPREQTTVRLILPESRAISRSM